MYSAFCILYSMQVDPDLHGLLTHSSLVAAEKQMFEIL